MENLFKGMPSQSSKVEQDIMTKLKKSRSSSQGVTLQAGEVLSFRTMCKTTRFLKPSGSSNEDLDKFDSVSLKAESANNQKSGLTLNDEEVDTVTFFLTRASMYAGNFNPVDAFCSWMSIYSQTLVKNHHPLDYKRDLDEDYSLGLVTNIMELGKYISNKTPKMIEDFAEKAFFCAVALIEKLEEAKRSASSISFNSREVFALMLFTPNTFEGPPKEEPSGWRAIARKFILAKSSTTMTSLTPKEVSDLIRICHCVPRVKPRRIKSKAAAYGSRSPEACLWQVKIKLNVNALLLPISLYFIHCPSH
jgi:hypothetical protein